MRRNLKIVWRVICNGWTWHLTATVAVGIAVYVLALLDHLGLV